MDYFSFSEFVSPSVLSGNDPEIQEIYMPPFLPRDTEI